MIEVRKIEGRWWPQGKPDAALFGILQLGPDAQIILETKEARSRSEKEFHEELIGRRKDKQALTIIGRDERDRPVTLFFCVQIGHDSRAGLIVTKYSAGYAFLGWEFTSWQDVCLNSVRLDFPSLIRWLAFSPFDKHKVEDQINYIGYTYPDDLVYRVDDGVELRICAEASQRHDIADGHRLTLTERRVFEIRWTTPVSMKEAHRWIQLLQRFLSFAMGTPTHLLSLQAFTMDHLHRRSKIRLPIEVWSPYSNERGGNEQASNAEWLFSFKDVKERFGEVFKSWLDYSARLEAVVDLYFAVIFNHDLYINHKFLFLAQALERYHAVQVGGHREPQKAFGERLRTIRGLLGDEHWRFVETKLNWANEKTLLERLTELLELRPEIAKDVLEQFPNFGSLVKDTRNYYTHFDSKLATKGRVANTAALVCLVDCMRHFLEVLFLIDLGFGARAMSARIKRKKIVLHE